MVAYGRWSLTRSGRYLIRELTVNLPSYPFTFLLEEREKREFFLYKVRIELSFPTS